jgi:hypothetical protein
VAATKKGDGTAVKEATEAVVAEQQAAGFRGFEVDPTPNEHYTVSGVIDGKPTPETDADHAADVRAQLDKSAREA